MYNVFQDEVREQDQEAKHKRDFEREIELLDRKNAAAIETYSELQERLNSLAQQLDIHLEPANESELQDLEAYIQDQELSIDEANKLYESKSLYAFEQD